MHTPTPLTLFDTVTSVEIPLHLRVFIFLVKPLYAYDMSREFIIVDRTHPLPEPSLYPLPLFDSWFGNPFMDDSNITRIRSLNPTESFSVYGLPFLISLHTTVFTSSNQCHIFFHTLPLHTLRYIALGLLSDFVILHSKLDSAFA